MTTSVVKVNYSLKLAYIMFATEAQDHDCNIAAAFV